MTQIDADTIAFIAPSQGCIAKNTKVDHRKARKGIAFESWRGVAGTASDFVFGRSREERD